MDFTATNHGSIFLLEPHTDAAIESVEEHLPAEALAERGCAGGGR